MINLVLCYPEGFPGRGTRESVVSSYIPPIGMEIRSSNLSGCYKVTGFSSSSDGETLGDEVYVELEEAN